MSYEISVGTLSDVMPLPPGHVLMISISSGVEVYTAATPEKVVPKSTPTMRRSLTGGSSRIGSRTGPLMASVELSGV